MIDQTFKREETLYLVCNNKKAFFTSTDHQRYKRWSCQKVFGAFSYLLDNIYIRFSTKLYRQFVGILMGTNCAPLVADLFLFCYDNQANIVEAFNSISRYLGDFLNIDNPYFEGMVNQIHPHELQLNKANRSPLFRFAFICF